MIASLSWKIWGNIEGFRLAEPERIFQARFYNGKMDLTEAEGLADLIDSETREQQNMRCAK